MKTASKRFKTQRVANFSQICAEINRHQIWELGPFFPGIDFTPLKEVGGRISCPLDREKRPSFHFSSESGLFHCWGCHSSGTILDFHYMKKQIGFFRSVVELADFFRIPLFLENSPLNEEIIKEKKSRRRFYLRNCQKGRRSCQL